MAACLLFPFLPLFLFPLLFFPPPSEYINQPCCGGLGSVFRCPDPSSSLFSSFFPLFFSLEGGHGRHQAANSVLRTGPFFFPSSFLFFLLFSFFPKEKESMRDRNVTSFFLFLFFSPSFLSFFQMKRAEATIAPAGKRP